MLVGFFLKMSLCHRLSVFFSVWSSLPEILQNKIELLIILNPDAETACDTKIQHTRFFGFDYTRSRKFVTVTSTCDRKSHVTGWLHSIRIGCDCLTPDRQAGDLPLLSSSDDSTRPLSTPFWIHGSAAEVCSPWVKSWEKSWFAFAAGVLHRFTASIEGAVCSSLRRFAPLSVFSQQLTCRDSWQCLAPGRSSPGKQPLWQVSPSL